VDIDDLLAVIAGWGSCANNVPDAFPPVISECFSIYCDGLEGQEWEDCITLCIDAVCEKNPSECD
jgi:hypothetical protein